MTAALEVLESVARTAPHFAGPASVGRKLLALLFDGPRGLEHAGPRLTADAARARLALGQPLLVGHAMPWHEFGLDRTWAAVCRILDDQPSSPAAHKLADAVDTKRLSPAELASALMGGPKLCVESVHANLVKQELDGQLGCAVLRLVLFPLLASWQANLGSFAAHARGNGACPCCGHRPLLAELRGLVAERRLRCGLCAADWPAERLFCPDCGQRDATQLGYLDVTDQSPQMRVDYCKSCGGRLKSISTLMPLSPPQLLAADFATLHLDVLDRARLA